jgi:hypothetical protein
MDREVRNQSIEKSEILIDDECEKLIIMHYKPQTSIAGAEYDYVKSKCSCNFSEI